LRLLRLKLRNFRGIEEREIAFSPQGITLVTGPNEVGKSSFAEALDLLFDEVDSTRKQSVRDVKPAHRDEGSEIEAEVVVGAYAFTYAKRFHRSPYTSLRVTRPKLENHTGREAHERVLEILDACIDTDLWRALRVQQGRSIEQEAVGDSAGLATALDAAAGVSTEGDRERNLLEAAERERDRYFTPGGKEKVELRRSQEHADAAGAAARACEERLARLEDAVQRESELAAEIIAAQAADRESEEALRQADARNEALQRLREAALRAESTRDVALARERQTLGEWKQRSQLLARHTTAEGEFGELTLALEESGPALLAVRGELEHATGAETAARASFEEARRHEATRSKDVEFHRGRVEHTSLTARFARIDTAEHALSLARGQLAELPKLSAAEVAAIRDAELVVETARARLEAEGPGVTLEAERDLSIELDGRSVHIAAGESVEHRLAEFLSLSIPGVGNFSVVAGAGAAERRKRLEEAETMLRGLCVEAGVSDHTGAVLAFESRRDAERRVREANSQLAEALGDANASSLRERAAKLAERIALYPNERDAELVLAHDLDAASMALEEASARATTARAAHEDAESKLRSVRERASRLEESRRDTELRHSLSRETLDDVGGRLASARHEASDDALAEACEASATAAREAELSSRGASEALAACEPERIEAELDGAVRARTGAAGKLASAREEQREVRGLIAGHGDEGLAEELEVLHARAQEAEREHMSLARRAAAAKLLFDTLSEEREAARAGYADPLRRHIEALGHALFGDGFGVTLDDDLQVVRRQHAGIDLAEKDLSTGAREQLAILQRLALALTVAEPEGMPVLLDDALGHADPDRRVAMARLLEEVGERCQIILLSCDPDRYRDLKNAHIVALD
jgi:energy-coupling factor transporter ATP-binding protein EcfA2